MQQDWMYVRVYRLSALGNLFAVTTARASEPLQYYLSASMETFGCLPSGIRCDVQQGKGRCVFLESAAVTGSVLISSIPIVYAILQSDLENRCSHCCVKSSTLMRCGRCRCVKYCDAECQKMGWQQHKVECKLLPKLCTVSRDQEQDSMNMRLLLITTGTKKPDGKDCTCSEGGRGASSLCSRGHVDALSIGPMFNYSETTYKAQSAASIAKISTSECEALLARFACNNFGILDELLGCVGAAVSPVVAMLNHSCQPNCVLRYDLKQGRPPSIKVLSQPDRYFQYCVILYAAVAVASGGGVSAHSAGRGADTFLR